MGIYEEGTITAVCRVLQCPDHRPDSAFTIKATAETSSGLVDVAVKGISGHRLANEIAAAWVASKLQLSIVANVLLVGDPGAMLKKVAGNLIGSGVDGRWIATRFSDLPPFSDPPDLCGFEALAGTQRFREIIVFDVLIANTDRMNRNLLWSNDNVCVFDHDKAFTGESWTAATLCQNGGTPVSGLFENNISFADQTSLKAMAELAKEWTGAITDADASDLDDLVQLNIISQVDVGALKAFIVARSANLPTLLQDVVDRNRN